MIRISEKITVEFEDEIERKTQVKKLQGQGFTIVRQYQMRDAAGNNHFLADISKARKGYVGSPVPKEAK